MSKTYKNYYVFYPIKARVKKDRGPSTDTSSEEQVVLSTSESNQPESNDDIYEVKRGHIYIGSRFATTLLDIPLICGVLGIVPEDKVLKPYNGDTEEVTAITLSTQSSAIRLGVFSIYSIVLIPQDPTKTIPPYGNRYTTRIPCNASLDARTASEKLSDASFPIEDSGESATYIVEPGSVKPVRLKKFSTKIPLN